jgi:hypothetical protein
MYCVSLTTNLYSFMSISVLFSDITYVNFIKLYDDPVFNVNFTVRLVKLVDVILYKLVVRETQYMYIKSTVPLNVFVINGDNWIKTHFLVIC